MSKSLGLLLLRAGLIRPVDLIAAHRFPSGDRLAERLIKLGLTTEAAIAAGLVAELRLPRAHPAALGTDADARALVPPDLAVRLEVCPLGIDGGDLYLGIADPFDDEAIRCLEAATGRRVVACIATPTEIRRAIARTYPVAAAAQPVS